MEWCRVNGRGEIEYINWDVAEQLAERHRNNETRGIDTAIATLAVAIREYVLRTTVPKIPGSK